MKNSSATQPFSTFFRKTSLLFLLVGLGFSGLFSQQNTARRLLIFSAREASMKPFSFTGHAFVSWGEQSAPDSAVDAPTTFGLFPVHGLALPALILGGLPASVVAGFRSNSKHVPTFQAVFEVDSAAYQAALDTAKAWDGRGYFLLRQNCVAFMNAVAEAAGLDTPHTRLAPGLPRRPLVYLKKLARRNLKTRVFIHQPMNYEHGQPETETFSLRPVH